MMGNNKTKNDISFCLPLLNVCMKHTRRPALHGACWAGHLWEGSLEQDEEPQHRGLAQSRKLEPCWGITQPHCEKPTEAGRERLSTQEIHQTYKCMKDNGSWIYYWRRERGMRKGRKLNRTLCVVF